MFERLRGFMTTFTIGQEMDRAYTTSPGARMGLATNIYHGTEMPPQHSTSLTYLVHKIGNMTKTQ